MPTLVLDAAAGFLRARRALRNADRALYANPSPATEAAMWAAVEAVEAARAAWEAEDCAVDADPSGLLLAFASAGTPHQQSVLLGPGAPTSHTPPFTVETSGGGE